MKSPFSRFFGGFKATEQIAPTIAEEVVNVSMNNIHPNQYQPRTVFDMAKIEELAQTIAEYGVIQPIVLREIGSHQYEIIAGERRYRAMKSLGWAEAPAIIRTLDDKETASIALIENLQREELTAIEEALAYEQLLQLHDLTQGALAQRLGKGQSTVANKLRLLKLPQVVQDALMAREISERNARTLLTVNEQAMQLQLFEQCVQHDWNVRQLEEHIQKQQLTSPSVKSKRKAVRHDIDAAQTTVRDAIKQAQQQHTNVQVQELETEDYYEIIIKIPKK